MATPIECWQPLIIGWPCLSAEAWAGWLQAGGSIVAIIASVLIVQYQHVLEGRRESEAEAYRRERFYSSICAIVDSTYASFQKLDLELRALNGRSPMEITRWADISLAKADGVLLGIPAHELESYQLTYSVMSFRLFVSTVIEELRKLRECGGNKDTIPNILDITERSAEFHKEFRAEISKLMKVVSVVSPLPDSEI